MFYTEEQICAARNISISIILDDMSEKYKRCGKEFYWLAHDSVKFHDNVWYQHSARTGGTSIEFCEKFLNMDFSEAMEYLSQRFLSLADNETGAGLNPTLNEHIIAQNNMQKNIREETSQALIPIIPDIANEPINAIEYLTKERGIDDAIVSFFIEQELIAETAQYHSVAFIGKNSNGEVKNVHLRNCASGDKKFRQTVKNSDSHYGFCFFGLGNKIYAFEAPIDMLSFITLYPADWKHNSYIALNGLSGNALCRALEEHNHLTDVVLCLDNDKAGNEACTRLERDIRDRGYEHVQRLKSTFKDWNEDLMNRIKEECEVSACSQLQFC